MNPRMLLISSLTLFFFLAGCGGGSGGSDSAIEGRWTGDKIYTGAHCADGAFLGVGSGTVVGFADLEVDGSDELGSVVSARDGDCRFEGTRTAEGFTAQVVDGCAVALASIVFRLGEKSNQATISYIQDIDRVPVEGGTIPCTSDDVAYVNR